MFYLKKTVAGYKFPLVHGGSSNDILLQDTVVPNPGAVKVAAEDLGS